MKNYSTPTDYTILKERVPDLYFKKGEYVPDDQRWACLGKPFLWVLEYINGQIKVWADAGYGFIKMENGVNEAVGRDMVSLGDLVAFGSFYEGYISKLYTPYSMLDNNELAEELEEDEEMVEVIEDNIKPEEEKTIVEVIGDNKPEGGVG